VGDVRSDPPVSPTNERLIPGGRRDPRRKGWVPQTTARPRPGVQWRGPEGPHYDGTVRL